MFAKKYEMYEKERTKKKKKLWSKVVITREQASQCMYRWDAETPAQFTFWIHDTCASLTASSARLLLGKFQREPRTDLYYTFTEFPLR